MRKRSGLFLFLIVLASVAAGVFVYPKFLGAKWRPWRLGLDLVGGSHLVYSVDLSRVAGGDRDSVVNGLRDVIERRVNLFGVSEPQVFTAKSGNESQLVVELAGVQNVKDAIAEIGTTPLLDFRELQGEGTSTVFVPTKLTGQYVKGAQLNFDSTTQAPQVSIAFTDAGSKIFEDLTARLAPPNPDPQCVNKGKTLGVFLDNQLVEAPAVCDKISGGNAVITGKFTIEQARLLVERFNAGALPAPITLIDQLTVSPTLGADSFRKAIVAGVVGTLLVIIFMIGYYGLFGVFAAVALCMYIALTLGVFKLVPITLTLAGLAGFILTIGMAVDANILIFERIKEELKKGISGTAAIQEGFRRAWPSIRDSNTSTIITAVILYFFTSSFVRGFALTLLFGVLVSMFSAITTTRLLLRVFVKDSVKIKNQNGK